MQRTQFFAEDYDGAPDAGPQDRLDISVARDGCFVVEIEEIHKGVRHEAGIRLTRDEAIILARTILATLRKAA